MYHLALIIPCFNEEKRIEKTVTEYAAYFKRSEAFNQKHCAIVLVNDGSTDTTPAIIKRLETLSTEHITIHAVGYSENRGKGGAIKEGCTHVDAEIYGFVDADMSFSPELTEQATNQITTHNAGLVIGQRHKDTSNSRYARMRASISGLLRRVVNSFLSLPHIDTQCGFKFFTRAVAKTVIPTIKADRFSFDIELIMRATQEGIEVRPLPVTFEHNTDSSISWKDGVRYMLDTISISERLQNTEIKKLIIRIACLTFGITAALYGWVLFKGYLFSDDFTWLWHGQKIDNSLYNIMTFHMSTFYSPVLNAFYSVAYSVFGYNPVPLFAWGLIVHACVSACAGIFSWQLTRSRMIAYLVSALVACGGLAYEPIVWIGANMHSMVALCMLASLIFFHEAYTQNKTRYFVGSFTAFLCALGTKESAIVTPALLLVTYVFIRAREPHVIHKKELVFTGAVGIISSVYLYAQFVWQTSGVWVQSGAYALSARALLKIPLVVMDNFIPISLIKSVAHGHVAIISWVISVCCIGFVAYKFRKLRMVWYGLGWIIVTSSPFIFFTTSSWWAPIASRYNYIPRIGAILVIASIFHHLVVKNTARRIISGFAYVVVITIGAQLYVMGKAITTEYEYVYATGRALTTAIEEVKTYNPRMIIFAYGFPFPSNNAHIVGAVSVITNYPESRIVFLNKNEEIIREPRDVLLRWNDTERSYEIDKSLK